MPQPSNLTGSNAGVADRIRAFEANQSSNAAAPNKSNQKASSGLRANSRPGISANRATTASSIPSSRHKPAKGESTAPPATKHISSIGEANQPTAGRISDSETDARPESQTQQNAQISPTSKTANDTEALSVNRSAIPITLRLQTASGKEAAGKTTLAQINHLRQNPSLYADLIEKKITYQKPADGEVKNILDTVMDKAKAAAEVKGKKFKGSTLNKAQEKALNAIKKFKENHKKEFEAYEKKHGPSLKASINLLRTAATQSLGEIKWQQKIFDKLSSYTNDRAQNRTAPHTLDAQLKRTIMTEGSTPGKAVSYKENDFRSVNLTELDAVIGWAEDEGGALVKFREPPPSAAAQKKQDAYIASWVKNYGGDISTLKDGDTLKDSNGNSLKSNDLSKGHLLNMLSPDIKEAAIGVDLQASSGAVAYVYSARGES